MPSSSMMTSYRVILCLVVLYIAKDVLSSSIPLQSRNPLKRRARTYQFSATDANAVRLPIVRYGSQLRKRQEAYTVPFGFIDTLPHLEVGIGNTDPPQETKLLLDTGSSEFWVYTAALRDEDVYDPDLSTSDKCYLTPTFNITYGDGTDIDGFYCTEIVQVGDLTVTNLTIGVPQTAVGEFAGDYGILGLAFQSGQRPTVKHATLVDKMFEEDLIPSRSYGIFLNQADSDNGEITFGGADLSRVVGKELTLLTMIQTIDPDAQRIFTNLTEINVALGEEAYDEANAVTLLMPPVLLDTGTPFSRLPPLIVEAFAEAFGFVEFDDPVGFYQAPCDMRSELGGIRFTFSDYDDNAVAIEMPWSEAIVEYSDGCLFAFAEGDKDADFFIMGQTFLQSTYLYVNLEDQTIGLGQAKWD